MNKSSENELQLHNFLIDPGVPALSDDWISSLCSSMGLSRGEIITLAAEISGYDVLKSELVALIQPSFDIANYAAMTKLGLVVGAMPDGHSVAAIARPFDSAASKWLAELEQPVERTFLADPHAIRLLLEHHENDFSAVAEAVGETQASEIELLIGDDISLASIQDEASPAVRLVSSTVFDALRGEASDIHIESIPQGAVLKFRIDGVLNQVAAVNNRPLAEQIIARIKILSELDIAEKRIPQDGRFRVISKGREIDIRVSIMPSIHGEDAVLRILDKKTLLDEFRGLTLDSLGFDETTVGLLRRLSSEPYGMMLVTGPTGSGKTTTLYAALSEINRGEDKIITIEDPVEYQLPGVLQIPVNEKKGLTFAVGLRSILRHDPDKIFVGEIRDNETAQIAVQSALTGHMVFTSVHANNAFDVIGRFIHMGVDPYNFVSSLTGVVAQRLIRQICPNCAEPTEVSQQQLFEAGIEHANKYGFRIGRGCVQCRNTGYKGRRAVAEVLRLTDELRELIIGRASIRVLKEHARAQGMRGLREVALDLVRHGQTTLHEVNRVTFVA
jgi:general secretion pathway protein E